MGEHFYFVLFVRTLQHREVLHFAAANAGRNRTIRWSHNYRVAEHFIVIALSKPALAQREQPHGGTGHKVTPTEINEKKAD